jgi:hypothetical protein
MHILGRLYECAQVETTAHIVVIDLNPTVRITRTVGWLVVDGRLLVKPGAHNVSAAAQGQPIVHAVADSRRYAEGQKFSLLNIVAAGPIIIIVQPPTKLRRGADTELKPGIQAVNIRQASCRYEIPGIAAVSTAER